MKKKSSQSISKKEEVINKTRNSNFYKNKMSNCTNQSNTSGKTSVKNYQNHLSP